MRAVACLCPRISISNVVASVIHDDKYIHFNETIVEGRANRSLTWVQQARVNGESDHDNVISV